MLRPEARTILVRAGVHDLLDPALPQDLEQSLVRVWADPFVSPCAGRRMNVARGHRGPGYASIHGAARSG
jgi:hypothetical protein